MIKRLFLSLALLAGLLSPVHSVGTINYSLSQQFDSLGKPLSGCKLYIYQAGTTTTQLAYQDAALTIAHPWPLVCDSAGRLPQFYLADGTVKIRLTSAAGVNQGYGGAGTIDGITVIGASSGSGSGTVVDPTTLLQTGAVQPFYGTGTKTGFVRANGRTIGSATSGASERANADCQELFEHLWTEDANLSVSTGRGASAAADWAANKTITLPDWRGRALAFLDDMGNSAAGRLTSTYFGTTATVLGAAGGTESHTLTTAQLAAHSHGVTDPGHKHNIRYHRSGGAAGGTSFVDQINTAFGDETGTDGALSGTTGISINNAGSGNAHPIVQPTMLLTAYIKL